ncbi:hypothetical protein A1OO_08660 [Enterovibrio norvegicus FF-33]|uniref:DUF3427 domain-containing protein n=1 Tax=Enterovibrio norvegicus TaxID=188144 RepID=UPI000304681C|nr:DUF3427 domain-containing protein [Enterovibrio norvegicus]OEE65870.1 hypothetical protein A1OO_08660 [Enterovibrio norvegicus FF-33]
MGLKLDKSKRIARLKTIASKLTNGDIVAAAEHFHELHGDIESYIDSTTYDVLINGRPYPPKAIFGLALTRLLQQQIRSFHFSGGKKSPCFEILTKLGFEIVPKSLKLNLYQAYSREDISHLFDPDYKFSSGSGRWGGTGIVSGYPTPNDHVFIVTMERNESNDYDDYLTEDGVLFWNTQNEVTANSKQVKDLLSHDPDTGTIYLFMRVNSNDDYTFFGPLTFNEWNPNSSKPVHFFWNLLSWPLADNIKELFAAHIKDARMPGYKAPIPLSDASLVETPPPKPSNSKKQGSRKPSGTIDWAAREQSNRQLGDAGEKAVIAFEQKQLTELGRPDLASRVEHVATINSSAGYDIKSFNDDESHKFIEVKTTTGGINTAFYISANEVKVSTEKGQDYWIYRLYNFKKENGIGRLYRVPGPVEERFLLTSNTYIASPK